MALAVNISNIFPPHLFWDLDASKLDVKSDKDIINRVKYDIFYMENWSILLDIKIIFDTIRNTLKGDDKAY